MTLYLDPTTQDICVAFLRAFTRQVEAGARSRRTLIAYEKALRLGPMTWGPNIPLSQLTPQFLSQMMETITADRGPAIGNQVVQVFAMAITDAIRTGLAPEGRNPAKLVRRNPVKGRRNPLSADDAHAFTELCATAFLDPGGSKILSPVMGAYFLTVLSLGLRRSEGTHLRIEEWDPLQGLVTISHHKTARRYGPKVLPANRFTAGVLGEVVRRQWHRVWFFPSSRSKRGHIEDPYKAWQRARSACGIAPRTRIHDLRHTFAQAVYAASRDMKTVQRLMGHASIAESSKYAGLLPAIEHRGDSQGAMQWMLGLAGDE